MSDAWINAYVGVPFKINGRDRDGFDCWGLICTVFNEQRGVRLPDWLFDTLPGGMLGGIIDPESAAAMLAEATQMGTPIDEAEPWAVAVAPQLRMAHHAGLIVCEGRRVLHCHQRGVVCVPLRDFLREYPKTTFWRVRNGDAPPT